MAQHIRPLTGDCFLEYGERVVEKRFSRLMASKAQPRTSNLHQALFVRPNNKVISFGGKRRDNVVSSVRSRLSVHKSTLRLISIEGCADISAMTIVLTNIEFESTERSRM